MLLLDLLSDEGSIPSASTKLHPTGPAILRKGFAQLLFLILTVGSVGSAEAVTLSRPPSVWLQTPTSITIAWQTDLAATGKILYGVTPALGIETSGPGPTADHAIALSGLNPGSLYYYGVVSDTDTLTVGEETFHTAPVTTEPFRFLAFGDLGRATPEQIEVAARIDSLNADLAILTGDIIYEAGEPQNFTPQYFDIYAPTIARTPFYSCLGNHDVGTLNGQPYLDAFYFPSNNPAGTERYYSFDYSNAHFVSIEVTIENAAPSAAMRAWLDADLAATDKHWKFVFFHVPMYSNVGSHGDDPTIAASLGPIFDARGVDVVFQGHNHFYTRTYPIQGGSVVNATQEPNYLNPSGPIYVVTGGAGRFLHGLAAAVPYEVFSKSTFHVTSVDVAGNSLSLQAVERDGTVIDAMTLTKDTPTGVAVAESGGRGNAHRFAPDRVSPNPSDGEAKIQFTLDRDSRVRVTLHDVAGRLVRRLEPKGRFSAGPNDVRWDGRDRNGRVVPAGIYFAVIQAENRMVSTRLLRLP